MLFFVEKGGIVAGTGGIVFEKLKRTAEFLSGTVAGMILAVFVHSQPGFTNRVPDGKELWIFDIAWIDGNATLPLINGMNLLVNAFNIVSLVGKKRTSFQR